MQVGALDAQVDDAKVLAPGGGERGFADRLEDAAAAQVADLAHDAQRDVDGMAFVEEWTRLVRRTSSLALGRPTGSAPLAAALLEQRELLRLRATLVSI